MCVGLRPTLVVIAVLAGAACPVPAGAAEVDTHVSIQYGPIAKVFAREFRGKVKSPKAPCEKERKVKLYEVHSGPDDLVSTTESKANGNWAIGNDTADGRFYVKVTKALGAGLDVCKPARSQKIKVSQT